jgi:hypothetical protein
VLERMEASVDRFVEQVDAKAQQQAGSLSMGGR